MLASMYTNRCAYTSFTHALKIRMYTHPQANICTHMLTHTNTHTHATTHTHTRTYTHMARHRHLIFPGCL